LSRAFTRAAKTLPTSLQSAPAQMPQVPLYHLTSVEERHLGAERLR
jgi:hypothetical protein